MTLEPTSSDPCPSTTPATSSIRKIGVAPVDMGKSMDPEKIFAAIVVSSPYTLGEQKRLQQKVIKKIEMRIKGYKKISVLDKDIGAIISILRSNQRKTSLEFAKEINMEFRHFRDIEWGETSANLLDLFTIFKHLGINIAPLIVAQKS